MTIGNLGLYDYRIYRDYRKDIRDRLDYLLIDTVNYDLEYSRGQYIIKMECSQLKS